MRAQTQVGGMYARGHGVAEDWGQAITWWKRAAAQGSMRAKYHLGQAYQYGSGVTRDLDTALQWYDESAAHGYRPAVQQILAINRQRDDEVVVTITLELEADTAETGDKKPPSVLHESVAALQTQGVVPLIALSGGGGAPLEDAYRIYLASYRGIQLAGADWKGIASTNADLLGGLQAAVAQIDLGRDKGIVYRLHAGPLSGITTANALCYKLSKRDIPCIVVKP